MRAFERVGTLSWYLVGVAGAAAVIGWGLAQLRVVVVPLLLGLLLAALCSGPVDRLERRGLRRSIGSLLVVGAAVSAVVAVVVATVPRLARELQTLLPKVQAGVGALLDWVQVHRPDAQLGPVRALVADPLSGLTGDMTALGTQALPLVGAAGELVAMAALTVVFWFFLVRDFRVLGAALLTLVPAGGRERAQRSAREGWRMLRRFLVGTSIVAAVDAVGIGVGLFVLDVPAAGALTLLVFVGGFIPVVGAAASGVLAVLVALAAGGFPLAVLVAAVVLVVQQVESNVLQPLVMRRAVRLHPIVTLAALAAGAATLGLLGAFLAIPTVAVSAAAVRAYRQR
jgi:putative heme transporter